MRYLTREQVLRIHRRVISAHGGSDGIREPGMLDAALYMPEASYSGELLHPDLPSAAAAYLFHICQNHPFVDGNKRVAAMSAYVFIRSNGSDLALGNDEFAGLVLGVASGAVGKTQLADIFRNRLTGLEPES